ncbi:MAG: transcription antitermination factor NusB [Chloroflexi bacterium]|nr:transcription antitermination factor NusB [Chloroflexota bacterium]
MLSNLTEDDRPENDGKNTKANLRRMARSIALQTLFESDAVSHDPDSVLARHLDDELITEETASFAKQLVTGVIGNLEDLDSIISSSAPNWPMEQMAKIDKNILRLAIFEILFDNDVPVKAAINEAIELAKSFGSDSSSRFVNGVLGTIVAQRLRRNNKFPA